MRYLFLWAAFGTSMATAAGDDYAAKVRPVVVRLCVSCHSTKDKEGSLDLERFATTDYVRKDVKAWQGVIEQLEAGEMPPKAKPQPTAEERKAIITWVREFLEAEAKARSGDPGNVPLRRLGNTEYDATIRDLTGVHLKPAREFPADGAGGEGFTNAAEALTDISPALFSKYLDAAKGIADRAVLLPDGFRFSTSKTRRDWTDECTEKLRTFYAGFSSIDGKLNVQPYLAAAVRHSESLTEGKAKTAEIAAKEKLNPKYFTILWQSFTDSTPSQPLDAIRTLWKTGDVPALAKEVAAWQAKLWKTAKVGSYVRNEGKAYFDNTTRQYAVDPAETDAAGNALFRNVLPIFVCFPQVVPTDEVVCLKMFNREDEPRIRLFLDEAARVQLDALWKEHRFVSRQAAAENDYLPQYIGFVTQDQPKEMEVFFREQIPAFKKRADDFRKVDVPEFDSIDGLPPAVALQPQRGSPTTRSSVGSVTTLSNLLRILYSRAGDYPPGQPLLYAESFSPNTPEGACPTCHGLGRKYDATEASMVRDTALSIREGAVAAWPGAWQGQNQRDIVTALGIDIDVPWKELPKKDRDWMLFTDETPQIPVWPHYHLEEVKRNEPHDYLGTFSSPADMSCTLSPRRRAR